jgi:soluble lytic murein transglycosylase-like protein
MPLSKNYETRAPRTRVAGLRTDTRSLLRSRPLQAVLVGVAALQGVAVANGKGGHDEHMNPFSTRRVAERANVKEVEMKDVVAMSLAPVVIAEPIKAAVEVRKPGAASEAKAGAKVASAAEALAERYRAKGFSVPSSLARQIHAAAVANDIPAEVAFGLVKTESGFKNSATSHVGAIGLTQLMPATARWLQPGVRTAQLRNSETNLRIGFKYLRDLIEKYDGNTRLALLAYNRGPGTVDRVLKRGGNPDNGYYDMVMGRRNSHR